MDFLFVQNKWSDTDDSFKLSAVCCDPVKKMLESFLEKEGSG